MEPNSNTYFEDTYTLLKKYTDDRLLLLKVQSAKKTAKLSSSLVFIFISSILAFFVLLFVGFMTAYYFAEKYNSTFYGFAAVSAIFTGIFLLFIILFRNFFSTKIKNMVTRIFFENNITLNSEDEA